MHDKFTGGVRKARKYNNSVSWGAKGLESCIGSRPLQPSLCILCELQLIEPLGGVLQFVQHTV